MTDLTDKPVTAGTEASGGFSTWPHWMKFLLVGSLALNLLIGAAAGMRYFYPERMERWSGAAFTQLLPRRFMSDLPDQRRREFLDLLKSRRDVFRESRAEMRAATLRFAEALERNPYDETSAVAAVQEFTKLSTQMVDSGTLATLEIVKRLTPEERLLLARHVRERLERMQQRRSRQQEERPEGG